jgi:sporulation protein YlmC with PRC-barrel domain
MDIPVNANVRCADGDCGQSVDVIVNPVTQQVTHVVVRERKASHAQRLVPVEWVMEAIPHLIHLRCTCDELAGMEEFIEREYITVWPSSIFSSSSMPEPAVVTLKHERVPPGELVIHQGARVEAIDGHVGQVDEFLIDPTNERITHLVLREGHLWGKKDVTIPVSEIDRIEENMVHLKLDKHSIEKLPSVPVRR